MNTIRTTELVLALKVIKVRFEEEDFLAISTFDAHNDLMRTIILDNIRIERIIKRIAFQILESAHQEKSLTVFGIAPRGIWVAEQLKEAIESTSGIRVSTMLIDGDDLSTTPDLNKDIEGKLVILVDDIINSGHTMMLCAGAIMAQKPKQMITASLVDRKHRKFPIHCDLNGLSLATTLQEHLSLEIKPKPMIYLE